MDGTDDEEDIESLLEGTIAAELGGGTGTKGRGSSGRGGKKEAVVLLERRGNVTEVGMEVRVGKEGVLVKGDLDVSFSTRRFKKKDAMLTFDAFFLFPGESSSPFEFRTLINRKIQLNWRGRRRRRRRRTRRGRKEEEGR